MNYLKLKYIKYVVLILFLYILFSILIKIINIYTFLFLIIIIYTFYNIDKKLFKKIVYKVIYKNKKNTLSFKNAYGAAKISLEGVEKINKKISDKVKAELLNYQKNKLESQLKTGDYKVTLFGAGSSGKTSIARSLLKNIVGQTSAKIGTTKQINSYKIRIPILKRNIKIIDTPGLFEPSKLGEEREKATIIQASNSDLVLFVLDQDINKYENYLIKELLKIGKKIIIVLNKCDLRSREENNLIKKNINSILVEIPNITSSPGVIPTAVWFEEPSKIPKIGLSALKMRENSNSDLFFHSNFKRLIGNSIEKINQKNILNPNECGEKFFQILWANIPHKYEIKRLVLTAPIDTYKGYREWLINLSGEISVDEIALVDEPTAASLGVNMPLGSKIMTLDIGGSTIDMNIVKIEGGEGKSKPIAELLKFRGNDVSSISKQKIRCAEIISKTGSKIGGKILINGSWIILFQIINMQLISQRQKK